VRPVLTFAVWWIALFWLWLAYQGEWNRIEWVAAAGAATLGAALLIGVAALGLVSFRVPLRAVVQSKRVPVQIAIDFGIVSLALVRRLLGRSVDGRFVTRAFPSAGSDATAAGDRAWRAVLGTYSPNAYVIDVDPGRHSVLLHALVENRR